MANNWDVWYCQPIPGAGEVTPETILNDIEDKNEEVYRRLMPHSNMYEDKEGRPIYWELTGEISSRFSEVIQSLSPEDLVIRHIRQQVTSSSISFFTFSSCYLNFISSRK